MDIACAPRLPRTVSLPMLLVRSLQLFSGDYPSPSASSLDGTDFQRPHPPRPRCSQVIQPNPQFSLSSGPISSGVTSWSSFILPTIPSELISSVPKQTACLSLQGPQTQIFKNEFLLLQPSPPSDVEPNPGQVT